LDALPLTPNGKLDRKALPAPEGDAYNRRAYEAPRTPTEEALAAIWREILKLDQVGIHDNFFELGGDSLATLRMQLQIKDRIGTGLSIRTIFQLQRIEQLAKIIETIEASQSATLPKGPDEKIEEDGVL